MYHERGMRTVQIRSIHAWLADNLQQTGSTLLHVHSSCEKAVTFRQGTHLLVLTTDHDGPATAVTSESLLRLVPSNAFGEVISLLLSSAERWIPPIFDLHPSSISEEALDQLQGSIWESGRSALLQRRFLPWVTDAVRALVSEFPRVRRGGATLIGLGPGLTPAGDDFLCGFFHVLYHSGLKVDWAELESSAQGTSWIGKEMLWWACEGVVARPFEDVLHSLSLGAPQLSENLQTALTVGHSSGADHLLGLWFGLLLLQGPGRQEAAEEFRAR